MIVNLNNGESVTFPKDSSVHFTDTGIIIIEDKDKTAQQFPYTSYESLQFNPEQSNLKMETLEMTELKKIH